MHSIVAQIIKIESFGGNARFDADKDGIRNKLLFVEVLKDRNLTTSDNEGKRVTPKPPRPPKSGRAE